MVKDSHLIDEFIDWQKRIRQLSESTIARNRAGLIAWANFISGRGEHELRHAQTASVIAYIDKRKKIDGVKDVTIADDLCLLRTFYKYLIKFGGTTDPTGSLPEFVCKGNYEGEYLTVDEMFAMLDAVLDNASPSKMRDYCIIALLWSIGLRSSELINLQWRDIDLEEGTLLVRNGKGRKQRQLILNDNILKDLKAYRKRVLSGPEHPVFCSLGVKQRPETQMSTKELSEICKNTAINAGITSKVTTLTLRHTFATHMYQAGVAVRDIQEMMGHATITETTVYLHVTTEAAKRVLNDHAYHIMHWEEE
jgi:site-specific recombinase XerD